MKNAIEKAIEGGYEGLTQKDLDTKNYQWDFPANVFLDPLFWQALGKALGWEEDYEYTSYGYSIKPGDSATLEIRGPGWIHNMHRFLDALIAGQTPDSFFDALLNTK